MSMYYIVMYIHYMVVYIHYIIYTHLPKPDLFTRRKHFGWQLESKNGISNSIKLNFPRLFILHGLFGDKTPKYIGEADF